MNTIAYSIRVSTRAKRARIEVSHIGNVNVIVPQRFDTQLIPAFVNQHRSWLESTLSRCQQRREEPSEQPAHCTLRAIDEHWRISYDDDMVRPLLVDHAEKHLRLSTTRHARDLLNAWLNKQAQTHLPTLLSRKSNELNLPFANVAIKNQKTRWGSCSSKGNINLNRNLLFLPAELVDYLLIHELCHTVYLNHSARYWQLVASFLPNYRDYDKQLRQATRYIPAWALAGR